MSGHREPAAQLVTGFASPLNRLLCQLWKRGQPLGPLKAAAEKQGRTDFTNLWAGQAIGLGREMPAAELTRMLAADAQARMARFAGP